MEKEPIIFYTINVVFIIVLICLFFTIFNGVKDNFIDLFTNQVDLAPISPSSLEKLCGDGTVPENGICQLDKQQIVNELVKEGYLYVDINGEPVYDTKKEYTVIEPKSKWFEQWVTKGFTCDPYLDQKCEDNNCDSYRGGNINDCEGNLTPGSLNEPTDTGLIFRTKSKVNSSNPFRVWCDTEAEGILGDSTCRCGIWIMSCKWYMCRTL